MSDVKMWYGITDFKPLLINPNKQDLEKFLGRTISYDPRYEFEKDGRFTVKLDIYGVLPKANDQNTKLTLWLDRELDVSRNGNQKFINGQGLTSYKTEGLPKTIYTKNFRKAYRGEEGIAMFLSKLTPWKIHLEKMTDGQTPEYFVDIERLLKGDVSFIQKLLGLKNTIKVYVGVVPSGTSGFMESIVYPKLFLNTLATNMTPMINALTSQYTPFKGNIAPIQETFEQGLISRESGESVGAETPMVESVIDDELPF